MRVLGFDASSKTIGWGVVENNKLIAHGYFKPTKKGNIFTRLQKTKKAILDILKEYKPDIVGLEEIIQFMKGLSTAKTIIALTTINRMVGLTITEYLGHPPLLCNVLAIRHKLKLSPVLPKKEEMPALVAKHLDIIFPYKHGSEDEKIEEDFDLADGIAVALYTTKYYKELLDQMTKLQTKKSTTTKQARKFKKQLKLLREKYKEITGNEYQGSI